MVQTHQHSHEEGMITSPPSPPQEAENIWHGHSDPQKVLQLHHWEHLDWLHHHLVWQLLGKLLTEGSAYGPVHRWGWAPCLQDLYTTWYQRKALKIVKDSSHPSHWRFSLLPHGKRYRSARSRTKKLLNSCYPQAMTAEQLIKRLPGLFALTPFFLHCVTHKWVDLQFWFLLHWFLLS